MHARWLAAAAAVWLVIACGRTESRSDSAAATHVDGNGQAPPVLLAAGDIASCQSQGDEATARLLDSLPGTVLALGDNVYRHGSMDEYRQCYEPSWGRHRARTRPTLGNHEYYVRGAAPYFAYFGEAAGPAGKGYYSFDVGGWHVVSLNSNIDARAGSPQERWLRTDLAAHPVRCTLAFWHAARFSSGGKHGSTAAVGPLWRALYEADADVIVEAHDHLYERIAPLAPDGRVDAARGMRSFIVGTGGGGEHHVFGPILAASEARYNDGPGLLKLTLSGDGYAWEFIAAPGVVRDRGAGNCH